MTDDKSGLLGLPARVRFEAEHGLIRIRCEPDAYQLDDTFIADCYTCDGAVHLPTDAEISQRIAELLQADHEAVLEGYTGVVDRLAFAELHVPAAQAAVCYAVEMGASTDMPPPVDHDRRALRMACLALVKQLGDRCMEGS